MSTPLKDPETVRIEEERRDAFDLVGHPGWQRFRQKLADRILALQDVSEYADIIQTGNATKLLREMKANKRVAEILYGWLREVEGTAQAAAETPQTDKSYIVKLED